MLVSPFQKSANGTRTSLWNAPNDGSPDMENDKRLDTITTHQAMMESNDMRLRVLSGGAAIKR
jgi:hypothetical protein